MIAYHGTPIVLARTVSGSLPDDMHWCRFRVRRTWVSSPMSASLSTSTTVRFGLEERRKARC